jgi:hypothetical protein
MSLLEIDKMMTLSMSHITEKTAKEIKDTFGEGITLDRLPMMTLPMFEKDTYGYFIYIGCYEENSEYYNVPKDLEQCIRFALEYDCAWLCLDCDGIEISELPAYEW